MTAEDMLGDLLAMDDGALASFEGRLDDCALALAVKRGRGKGLVGAGLASDAFDALRTAALACGNSERKTQLNAREAEHGGRDDGGACDKGGREYA